MEALIVPRNPETEALLRRFNIALTELRAVKNERDSLREDMARLREHLADAHAEVNRLRELCDAYRLPGSDEGDA